MPLSCQECLATSTASTLTPTRISRRLLVVAVQDQKIANMMRQVVELQLEGGLVVVVVGVREMALLVALQGQQFAKEGEGVVELEEVEIWLVG